MKYFKQNLTVKCNGKFFSGFIENLIDKNTMYLSDN